MRTRRTTLNAEEVLRLSTTGANCRYELVQGVLFEMPPAGARHGSVAMQVGSLLSVYVRANQLGQVFAAETGFILRRNPDTVRAPDASFVAGERLPEVVSPSETPREVEEKVADWLGAGTHLVWTIYPASRTVTVYRSPEDALVLSEEDTLDGGDVIPGFTCSVRDLFT